MTAALALPLDAAPRAGTTRLLVASAAGLSHASFADLPDLLRPGDLLVVNDSATLPAALPAGELRLHLSTPLPPVRSEPWPDDGFERWVVELREGTARFHGGEAGEHLALPGGGEAELLARYLGGDRLWVARLRLPEPLLDYLARHGRPIRYRHSPPDRPLADYQTVFAREPGSAEMPSAGRPFTSGLVTRLLARGIAFAPVTLHTGVSSLEAGEHPYPERFRVSEATAKAVNAAERVIAVGTTVVRALETAAEPDGAVEHEPRGRSVREFEGWTRLVIDADREIGSVDGMITGWHEPDASHLAILDALAGRDLIARSYAAARGHGYRWHEFGDAHLLLP
jgi:S-adenosylmethionine:tRNA ribosyltransferase-isomerase